MLPPGFSSDESVPLVPAPGSKPRRLFTRERKEQKPGSAVVATAIPVHQAQQPRGSYPYPGPSSQPPRSVEQNEMDLYYGPLLQELGVDLHLTLRKSYESLPFVAVSDDVAQSGDMLVGLISLVLFTAANWLIKESGSHMGFIIGAFIYGSLVLKALLTLLLQGRASVGLYTVMSALSYGLVPLFLILFAGGILRRIFPLPRTHGAVVFLYSLAAAWSSAVVTKFLNAVAHLSGVRLLIGLPAFLVAMCYVLVQLMG
ncbi:Yip [Giardia muris]|uniref:Yip n=1 Tax=Giardia muris TaxID=5742 RepID=A0A4Z1T0Z9_GIAMU|nr:Yip [Giardia muris]|eukprot:TNJ29378.1 Yip [Giardia muris]